MSYRVINDRAEMIAALRTEAHGITRLLNNPDVTIPPLVGQALGTARHALCEAARMLEAK